MTENNKFQYCEEENGEFPFPYIQTDDGETIISLYDCCKHLNILYDENEQLKQFQEQVAEVIESKMGDNVCNDYKIEVLKEIWNELELDKVWFE